MQVVTGQVAPIPDPAGGVGSSSGVAVREAALSAHVADLILARAVAEHAGVEAGHLLSAPGAPGGLVSLTSHVFL